MAARGTAFAATLAIVALLAFAGAWVSFTDVRTETVTERVNVQQVSSELETVGPVTLNNSLYRQGTVLVNHPVYFYRASPVITLRLNTTAPGGEPVAVSHEVTLRYVATRTGAVFWEQNRTLIDETARTADGSMTSTVALDMRDVNRTVAERRGVVAAVGTLQTVVTVHVSYETERYAGTFNGTTNVVLAEGAFWFADRFGADRTHSETVARTVEVGPDPATYTGLAALGVLALAGAIGTSLLARRVDRVALETQLYRDRYDEWISDGEFPTGTDKKHVRIGSLEDLVDVAIDSNKRVLYDEDFDIYAVIDSDIIYYFSVEGEDIDSWLEM